MQTTDPANPNKTNGLTNNKLTAALPAACMQHDNRAPTTTCINVHNNTTIEAYNP
jgi:hypothetical protein